jgi:hypothetical protein
MDLGFAGAGCDRGFCSGRNGRTAIRSDPTAAGGFGDAGLLLAQAACRFPGPGPGCGLVRGSATPRAVDRVGLGSTRL